MAAELTQYAKGVAAGGTLVTRSGIYRLLSAEASRRRADGQSPQQSFAKMITHDPVARELFNVHQALGRRALTACDPNGPFGQEITKGLRKALGDGFDKGSAGGSHYDPGPHREMDQPGSDSGDGGMRDAPDLDELVAAEMKTGTQRPQAMAKVLGTPQGTRAYSRERSHRLARALRGS
jgi:hypothetical protein